CQLSSDRASKTAVVESRCRPRPHPLIDRSPQHPSHLLLHERTRLLGKEIAHLRSVGWFIRAGKYMFFGRLPIACNSINRGSRPTNRREVFRTPSRSDGTLQRALP